MKQSPKDKLITDNVKLVYYVYNRFGKSPLMERNKDDLISEGMLGLCQAANTFDESRGTKFCTYATLCIRNAMLMYLRKLRKYTPYEVSINDIVGRDNDGNELTWADVIEDESVSEDSMIERLVFEEFEKRQKPIDKVILCEKKKGASQKAIGSLLDISQSYVSRRIKNMKEKYPKIGV